jgi:DnaJ family protein C protein 10
MNLLPEFRKASQLEAAQTTLFATVDCSANAKLCEQYGIRSYPTTMLFNNTIPHNYHGFHRAQDINDFVQVRANLLDL